jgi:hypothetical protein
MDNQAPRYGVSKRCCLPGTAQVAMADGSVMAFGVIAAAGRDVNVLALDTNGVAVPRMLRAPHLTERNATVYRVVLENERYFDATAGHLAVLADLDARDICTLDLGTQLWYAKRDREVVIRPDGQSYRAHEALYTPTDIPGRPVRRACERCGAEYVTPYAQRDRLHCSTQCRLEALAQRLTKSRASTCAGLPGVRIKAIDRISPADVYNGTVSDFHNLCLVLPRPGETRVSGATDFMVAVASL